MRGATLKQIEILIKEGWCLFFGGASSVVTTTTTPSFGLIVLFEFYKYSFIKHYALLAH